MTEKERAHIIAHIELNYDVNSIRYKDLNLWPIIRLYYSFQYRDRQNTITDSSKTTKNLVAASIDQLLLNIKLYYNDLGGEYFCRPQSDLIFLARQYNRREKVKERYFSKYADSLDYYLPNDIQMNVWEYSISNKIFWPRFRPSRIINFGFYSQLLVNKLIPILKHLKDSSIERFFDFLDEEGIKTDLYNLNRM